MTDPCRCGYCGHDVEDHYWEAVDGCNLCTACPGFEAEE